MIEKFNINKHKIPFTHICNVILIFSHIWGLKLINLKPMIYGVLFVGTVMAQVYNEGISEKYGYSINFIKFSDIIIHWLPMIFVTISTQNEKIKSEHMLYAIIIPFVYMLFDFYYLKFLDFCKTIKDTYPKVPIKLIIKLYVCGILTPYIIQFCSKNVSKLG